MTSAIRHGAALLAVGLAFALPACGSEKPSSEAVATGSVLRFDAPLPADGYAVGHRDKAGVKIYNLDGKRFASLPGARIDDYGTIRIGGRNFEPRGKVAELEAVPAGNVGADGQLGDGQPGCISSDARDGVDYAVCGAENASEQPTIVAIRNRKRTTLTGFPKPLSRNLDDAPADLRYIGHWSWVTVSPDGAWLLAQFSSECESPNAFLIPAAGGDAVLPEGGNPELVPESHAIGWATTGEAIVLYPSDAPCGSHSARPGYYAVKRPGDMRLVFAVDVEDPEAVGPPNQQAIFWTSG